MCSLSAWSPSSAWPRDSATTTVLGSPALADCISPNIRFEPVVVSRGQAVRIVGQAFGDECFDAGVPDGATGELGEPQQDIRILIVQGGEEHPVGEVDADDDYEFSIEIVIPDSLESGNARVLARLVDGVEIGAYDSGGMPVPALKIIDADPSATPTTNVAQDSSPATNVIFIPDGCHGCRSGRCVGLDRDISALAKNDQIATR